MTTDRAGGSEADRAFKIERHGIDIIQPEERHGKPRQLFWIWGAALFAAINFIIGAVVANLGLSLWGSLTAIFIGDTSFLFVGLIALAGPAAGTSTIVISRAPFGVRGNVLPTFLSWLTIVGWECVNSVVGVLIFVQLLGAAHMGTGTLVKVVSTIIYLAILAVLAVFGHATIARVNRYVTWALAVSFIGVLYFGLRNVDWGFAGGKLATGSSVTTWIWAVTIVAAAQGFGYVNMGADYTRYLAKNSRKTGIVGWTALGAYIPATITQGAGVIIGTKLNMFDPIGSLSRVMPGWFLVPFLLIMAVTMIAVNVLNTYSSGLNLLALGLRIPRYLSVLFDVAIITIFVFIALFVWNYINAFENFLALTLWWITPWTGIFLADLWLRRYRYHSPSLVDSSGGRYFYSLGTNWRAYPAFIAGGVCAALCTNSTIFVGPIARVLDGTDLSILAGTLVGGVIYSGLMARELRAGAAERSAIAAQVGP